MELFDVIDKNKCTGCMACKNKCPRNVIQIIEDEKTGFLYPKINNEYCTNCGLCKIVCPVENKLEENLNKIKVYACKNKNEEIRLESSSGGIFTLIAKYILENDGVVFGARFNEDFEVIHDYAETEEDLAKFRGSKYLQSKVGNTYKKAKEFLDAGRKVLFTGTPCQIEGLLGFLRKDYKNLYTQDIICHGVPSPKVWKKYLEYKKEIFKEKPKSVNFRRKDIKGWNSYYVSFKFTDKEENTFYVEDPYMNLFLKNINLRETCYNCNFKKEKRKSDLTVADFWGIKKVRPEMNDEKGTSAVLINTSKGKELFENIIKQIEYTEEDIEDIKRYNPSFIKSSICDDRRDDFFEDIEKMNFKYIIEKYI